MKILLAITIVLVLTTVFLIVLFLYLKWHFTRKGRNKTANGLPKTSIDYLQDFENSAWFNIFPLLIFTVVIIIIFLTVKNLFD